MTTYETKTFTSWDDLLAFYRTRESWLGWAFRGQRAAEWELKSKLERVVRDRFRFSDPRQATLVERALTTRFQRQAHNYISSPPRLGDRLEWLSIMQHHGAPTRLLDWTYSFYIAAFFALEALEPDDRCAVWAIDYAWIHNRLSSLYEDYKVADSSKGAHLWRDPSRVGVFPVNPVRLGARVVVQQGTFFAPSDIKRSFLENFEALGPDPTAPKLLKLVVHCEKDLLKRAYADLYSMNVTWASLMPGLDGFARGLENFVAIPDRIGRAIWLEADL